MSRTKSLAMRGSAGAVFAMETTPQVDAPLNWQVAKEEPRQFGNLYETARVRLEAQK